MLAFTKASQREAAIESLHYTDKDIRKIGKTICKCKKDYVKSEEEHFNVGNEFLDSIVTRGKYTINDLDMTIVATDHTIFMQAILENPISIDAVNHNKKLVFFSNPLNKNQAKLVNKLRSVMLKNIK